MFTSKKETCQEWVRTLCENDLTLLKIIKEFVFVITHASGNHVWHSIEFDLNSLEKFVKISEIFSKIIKLKEKKEIFNSLSSKDQVAIEKFLEVYLKTRNLEKQEIKDLIKT